jgi:hypothetical protein
VLELEVLVLEAVAVDRLAATAVARGKVTALDPGSLEGGQCKAYLHEVLDDTVEARALVAVAEVVAVLVLAGGEGAEVLDSLGDSPACQ